MFILFLVISNQVLDFLFVFIYCPNINKIKYVLHIFTETNCNKSHDITEEQNAGRVGNLTYCQDIQLK